MTTWNKGMSNLLVLRNDLSLNHRRTKLVENLWDVFYPTQRNSRALVKLSHFLEEIRRQVGVSPTVAWPISESRLPSGDLSLSKHPVKSGQLDTVKFRVINWPLSAMSLLLVSLAT